MPMKLKNIRIDLQKDDWNQLETVLDASVCIEGIFEFLKTFSHPVDNNADSKNKLTPVQVRRLLSFRMGLVHFFASLMNKLHADSSDFDDGQIMKEQCLSVMADSFPPELSTSQLT